VNYEVRKGSRIFTLLPLAFRNMPTHATKLTYAAKDARRFLEFLASKKEEFRSGLRSPGA